VPASAPEGPATCGPTNVAVMSTGLGVS
jgi:hypothetical protein